METLLVVGCGDVARRALPALVERYRVLALFRAADRAAGFVAGGAEVVIGDLDAPASLVPLAGRADRLLYLAPPPEVGEVDARACRLGEALAVAHAPRRVVYMSTSGVYGDCGGDWVDESRPVAPATGRAARRVDAERFWTRWAVSHGAALATLRVPGIYAADRLPVDRLRRGVAVLRAEDDVYTNHIHADDLAGICVRALADDVPAGTYNTSDDSAMKMADWFDLVADRQGLARPPRIARTAAEGRIPPALLSFMSESRRLVNARMKRALGVALRYPTVREGVPFATVAAPEGS
jgi:nucleoside-diphosphate-sugar epimerase